MKTKAVLFLLCVSAALCHADESLDSYLKIKVPLKERETERPKVTVDNSNVREFERPATQSASTDKGKKKSKLTKTQLHRLKLWTARKPGTLSARLAPERKDIIIKWAPKWGVGGTDGVRVPASAISSDRSVIAIAETTGLERGPYGSRLALVDANAWEILKIIRLDDLYIKKMFFAGNKIIALSQGQDQLGTKNTISAIDPVSGKTESSLNVDYEFAGWCGSNTADVFFIVARNSSTIRRYCLKSSGIVMTRKIESENTEPALYADGEGSLFAAGDKTLEKFSSVNGTLLNKGPSLPSGFKSASLLKMKNLFFISPAPECETRELYCNYESDDPGFKYFGEPGGGGMTPNVRGDSFFMRGRLKGNITEYALPTITAKTSALCGELKPRTSGRPRDIYYIGHADCLAVLDTGGNFYLLQLDRSGRRWLKELVFTTEK